jgi:hypothetical protein
MTVSGLETEWNQVLFPKNLPGYASTPLALRALLLSTRIGRGTQATKNRFFGQK